MAERTHAQAFSDGVEACCAILRRLMSQEERTPAQREIIVDAFELIVEMLRDCVPEPKT